MRIFIKTPIGELEICFDRELRLTEISKKTEFEPSEHIENLPREILRFISSLNDYFLGNLIEIDFPFELYNLSNFDRVVLDLIKTIPYGKTVSYKWIAEKLKTSPRAIGQALKRNPIPIVIPCHRIIKTDGQIGGYSLGIEAKKWLIEHERTTLYKLLSHRI